MDPRIYKQLHEIETRHWWFAGRRDIIASVLDRFEIRPERILDVGCGAGTNLDLLAERYPESSLHGIDVEIEPLRFCRSDRAVPVHQADVCHLPFRSEAFDLVAALDTLEHIEDDAGALGEVFRVCRPGGTLLLTVPAFPFLWGNIDDVGHHFRRYRRDELLRRVEAAGFSIRMDRYFNYLLFAPIAAVRVAARLAPGRAREDGGPVRSDFDLVKGGPLNALLRRVFAQEARLLGLRVPFGVSLLCVAEREEHASPRGRASSDGT